MHIRTDDTVQVIAGSDRGLRAKVQRVIAKHNKVVIEGVNRVYKHLRRSQKNPQGGRLSKEMPIAMSNVQLVCPRCNKPTRTGVKHNSDGSKARICRKCKAEIGLFSPPKKKAAAAATAKK
ncbi:MAG TPA: 50S ribosomal protein L24 [Pirellulales bacterium]|jgi:large subunit ribosomal protein L24|nr:50S ribosomal protein L24 [Pirellulales bacterium]